MSLENFFNPESVAIVGHTGAGKSSLARILLRFYDFQSGDILIDGYNIRNLNLEEYRKRVVYDNYQSPTLQIHCNKKSDFSLDADNFFF